MPSTLKILHSIEDVQIPNPLSAGGWHGVVEDASDSFARLAYRFGFKSYIVLDISKRVGAELAPEINYTNLDPEFLKHLDTEDALGSCSLFQVLAQTCVPFSWKSGVDAYTGLNDAEQRSVEDHGLDELLSAFDYSGGFSIPVSDPRGNRSVVVFVGPYFDNSARHSKLVVETIELFDAAVRNSPEIQTSSRPILTELEVSCLRGLAIGNETSSISQDIGLSEHVISVLLSSICKKLNAKNAYHAIALAVALDIVEA